MQKWDAGLFEELDDTNQTQIETQLLLYFSTESCNNPSTVIIISFHM